MSEAELTAIEDVGPRIAAGIVDYFSRPEVRTLVERLRAAGLKMEMDVDTSTPRSEILAGKQIVISGTFTHNSRDRYKELIELNGGKNVGSISKKTSFVSRRRQHGPRQARESLATRRADYGRRFFSPTHQPVGKRLTITFFITNNLQV